MDRETVEEIKRHFGVVAEGLHSDIRGIAEGQDLIRERLDGVDTRLGRVETRLDHVEVRLDHVEARLGGLEGRMDGLTDVVQRVHSELTGRLNDHDRRLTAVERKP